MTIRRLACGLGLLLGLWGCDGTDLGSLVSVRPEPPCEGPSCNPTCPGPDCPPPPPPACSPELPDLSCGVGACYRSLPACDGPEFNTCVPGEPEAERCNDRDDDCDGEVDEGCDDDGDDFCDAAFEVEGTPAVCPKGGSTRLDCDDEDPNRHPARPEICDDDIDNNCDGRADYLDFAGCTHITASFEDADGIRRIDHGTFARIRATVTPPSEALERTWAVVEAVPADHCVPEDVLFDSPVETADATQRQVGIVDDPTKLDCRYTLELRIDGVVADQLVVQMRNLRPIVSGLVGGTLDEFTLVVTLAEGTNPNLVATVPDDPDQPVTVRWSGTDADLLACSPPCESPTVRFAAPPPVGTYTLRVQAADSFDGVFRNRTVQVRVVGCTWARLNGTGDGSGPALADAQGDLQAAVRAAADAGTNVCFAAGGRWPVAQLVRLPASVGLLGGFNGTGGPANNVATLLFEGAGRLTFAPGHTGRLARLSIVGGPANPVVAVTDASPTFTGVTVAATGGEGRTVLGIQAAQRDVEVRLESSVVRVQEMPAGATGVAVRAVDARRARLRTRGTTNVEVSECRGTCRGIHGLGQVDMQLSGRVVDVEALGTGSSAIGVDLEAQDELRPTGRIVGHARITAYTQDETPADRTVGIRLARTRDLEIDLNVQVGARTETSGRRFSAGIADGAIDAFGQLTPGASEGLRIEGNRRIAAGRWRPAWAMDVCADGNGPAAVGTEIGAGVLLVGTRTATLANNGNNASRDNGVFGAASSALWQDPQRVFPPMVPGVWTIDTDDVAVLENELRSGVLTALPNCMGREGVTAEIVRDGLAPWGNAPRASRGLRYAANGLVTGRSNPLLGAPRTDEVPAVGVALGGGDVRFENDYVAVTRGTALTAFAARGPTDLRLLNCTLEVDRLSGALAPERGLVLDAPGEGAVSLVNTIVLLRDAGGDDAIGLDVRQGGATAFREVAHDLIFLEAAARAPEVAYVRTDALGRLGEAEWPMFDMRVPGRRNLLLPPLFQAHAIEHRRSITRLSPDSPAIDAGRGEGAPRRDRFGGERPRGGAVDIGHHERAP